MRNRINKISEVVKVLFKEKYNNIFKHLFYVFLVFCFSVLLMGIFPDSSKSIADIFTWFIISYTLVIYFRVVPDIVSRQEIKLLEKRMNKERKESLYEWLGRLSVYDLTLYSWLKDPQKGDILLNLRKIKERLSSNVGKNISDYYLLKKYLIYHGENNFMNSVWKSIGPAIFALFGGAFLKLGILDKVYDHLLKSEDSSSFFETIEMILQVGVFALFFLLMIMFIRNEFTKEKRRIDLLISIIDTVIEEKSNKGLENK